MAEYKRQITFATVAAVAIVVVLASAVVYLPLGTNPTTTSSGTNFISTSKGSQPETSTTESSTIPQWVPIYLDSQQGCSSGSGAGSWTPSGCWSTSLSEAVVFNCVAAAAGPEGCTLRVPIKNTTESFIVTVWLNYTGNDYILSDTLPPHISNCTWSYTTTMPTHPPLAYCPLLNSTSFLLAESVSTSPA